MTYRLIAALSLIPMVAHAERFDVYVPINEVILHPQGAWVHRQTELDLPAGHHVIVMPSDMGGDGNLVDVTGAEITAQRFELVNAPRPAVFESAETALARAKVADAEAALQALNDQREALLLPKSEGDARLQFLQQVGESDNLAQMGPKALQQMVAMIGAESRQAAEIAKSAEIAARDLDDQVRDATAQLARAQSELDSQQSDRNNSGQLVLNVTAQTATKVAINHRHYVYDAGWTPVYEFRLDSPDSTEVKVSRHIQVNQQSEEAWNDITLTLTTAAPLSQSAPSELRPNRLQIVQPRTTVSAIGKSMAGEVMMEPVVVVEEAAQSFASSYDGLSVTYEMPSTVTIPTSIDQTSLSMPEVTFDANAFAVAVPSRDDKAFMVAELTNTGSDPLPGNGANVLTFLNDTLVGTTTLSTVAAGEQFTVPFGGIDGLWIREIVLDDDAGDRGILRGSLFETKARRIDLENLTPRNWNIRLFAQIPYSGQEDLEITWNANPAPDVVNADDKRGVMQWNMTLAAGEKRAISLDQRITWPEGWDLR